MLKWGNLCFTLLEDLLECGDFLSECDNKGIPFTKLGLQIFDDVDGVTGHC